MRVPLPQADYHKIRHQHGAGEVCTHHDHLIRWHSSASQVGDVAVLHWHWFLPSALDQGQGANSEDDSKLPAGPVYHAHADGLEPDWVGDLVIQADDRGQFAPPSASGSSCLKPQLAMGYWLQPFLPSGFVTVRSQWRDPGIPCAPLVSLFQQSNC
jgi:hypothetical protein